MTIITIITIIYNFNDCSFCVFARLQCLFFRWNTFIDIHESTSKIVTDTMWLRLPIHLKYAKYAKYAK
jgi:hypothetical protein